MNITNMTANLFDSAAQTVTVQLTSDSPTFCPQTDMEYDTGTKVMVGIRGIILGLVILGTTMDLI